MKSFSYYSYFLYWISITAFTVYTCIPFGDASTVIVDTHFGKIQGLRKTDEATGQSYISFRGIPYAKPPLGELRFAKPQPHPKFDGIFDGTQDKKIICPHPEMFTFGETEFTEDCLILNIQTKDIGQDGQSLRKVLVFIHGGGFMAGSSSVIESKTFVFTQYVIVVTINYRLGILGFLSTENEVSPGNYGLWDQTLALRWVKDNIRAFGGDPDDITIAGESAGGASVTYQMISPHAKGLFTKAYPQSGTATSVFAQSMDTLSLTLQVAKSLDCWNEGINAKISHDESKAVIQCLRHLPESVFGPATEITWSKTMFVPVVDGDFISNSPQNLLKNDSYLDSIGFFDRSYLVGIDNDEAGAISGFFQAVKNAIFMNNQTSTEENESAWEGILSASRRLNIRSRLGDKGVSNEVIVDAIDDFYGRRYKDTFTALVEIGTDLNILIPSLDFLLAASRRPSCSAFFLYFDHFPSFAKGATRGTTHGIDLMYWLDISPAEIDKFLMAGLEGEMSEEELKLKSLFSTLLGDFIETGYPGQSLTTPWPRFDPENSYYLNFNPNPWVSNFLQKDRQEFWLETVPNMLAEHEQHGHEEL